jgi:small GTP-binding protein
MGNQHALPTVCIVGRTNVGKSTLFNALAGRRKAVVKDQPGVTRDRYYEVVTRFDFPFALVDTGALVGEEDLVLHEAVKAQTELAMKQSDLILVVFDGLHGLHPLDSEVVDLVRQMDRPTIYIANKCEKPSAAITATELYGLGLEEILPLSAAHRRGIKELLAKMESLVGPSDLVQELVDGEDDRYDAGDDEDGDPVAYEELAVDAELSEQATIIEERNSDRAVNIAIIGKPNVGKSTFVNRI